MTSPTKHQIADVVALTPTQQGMLLAYLKDPATSEYFIQATVDLEGDVNPERARAAWQTMVDRHASLRSLFRWEGISQPVQLVLKQHPVGFEFVDLQLSTGSSEDLFRALKGRDAERRHVLDQVPFRVALARLAPGAFRLLLSYHHILMDGWSLGVLAADFLRAYEALGSGAPAAQLPPPPLSAYVRWHGRQDFSAHAAFWKRTFGSFAGHASLRLKRETPLSRTRNAEKHQSLPRDLEEALRRFASSRNVTLAGVLYAAYAVLLSRYAGAADVVFGTTVSGRNAPVEGVHLLVGNLINTPPLRVRVEGETLESLCQQVGLALREREPFETTPLTEIHRAVGTDALYDTIFVVENYALALSGGPVRLHDLRSEEATSYDLTVSATVHEGLALQWSYREGRLLGADVERMQQRYARILAAIAAAPETPVAELDVFAPGERERVVNELSRGPDLPPATISTCVEGVVEAARRDPEKTALVCAGSTLRYGELEARSAALAAWLRAEGVSAEEPVIVLTERSVDWVVALLGVFRAGAAYVPVSARVPPRRLQEIVEDCGARFVLAHAATLERAAPVAQTRRVVDLATVPEAVGAPPAELPRPESLAYVIYTSGSSGKPKGVMIEHRALLNTLTWYGLQFGFSPESRVLAFFDATADTSLEDVLCTLMAGGTLHVATRELSFDRGALSAYLVREHIPFLSHLPSALRELLPLEHRVPGLDTLVVGSEPLAEELKDRLLGLGYTVFNCYGTTETSIDSLTQRCGEGPVSLGRPNAGTRCLILDSRGAPCPIGAPGELVLLGPGLARGYFGRDDLTARVFVPCPALSGERMYRTGDLALWQEDGEVRFLGRLDAQVKLNGFRVEPHEIEATLRAHPQVLDAAVSVHTLSGGSPFLSAFVVLAAQTELEAKNLLGKGLRSFLGERIPEHMIPHRFFVLGALPHLPNGKVDTRGLSQRIAKEDAQEYVGPEDDIERAIEAVWGSVLGHDRVTTRTPFRELGGDSLMLIRIYSQLNNRFPGVLKVQDLFDNRTIHELAAVVRERTAPPKTASDGIKILDF